LLALLPEDYRAAIRKEITCPSTEYDDEWIDQVKKYISDLHVAASLDALSNREDPRSVGQTAAKIRELCCEASGAKPGTSVRTAPLELFLDSFCRCGETSLVKDVCDRHHITSN